MQQFNIVPKNGTFGSAVDKINANFTLAWVAIGNVEYSTSRNKGLFASVNALTSTIPNPQKGDWAMVGSGFPAEIYVCNTNGTWTDSGQTYEGDNVNLNDYMTAEETQRAIEEKVTTDDSHNCDFSIEDESGYAIARFENGHIKTKNFDSSKEAPLYDETGTNTNGAMTQRATTSALTKKANTEYCEEDGAFFTDEKGRVFMKYDSNGFDVSSLSPHFLNLIGSGKSPIVAIDEDFISLITDNIGRSAMLWSNKYGFDVNKIAYATLKRIKDGYVKSMEEWFNLGTGMFIHWGVYSVLKGHYTGIDIDGNYVDSDVAYNAEWIYKFKRIPDATYKAYQSQFTAANWDADLIAQMAYNCGMKYIVITAKHHEGFTLYESEYANWDISTTGASGKDPLMELKKACDKYGIKFCLYFSHVRDWAATGGFDQEWKNNNVDPYNSTQHHAYIDMTVNILKEMISRYDPYILWYDGPVASDEYTNVILDAQLSDFPQVITNWRLKSDYSVGDYATGEDDFFHGDREQWWYAENCYTLNGSWGYWETRDDEQYMCSLPKLIGKFVLESKARSQNALINIGPKADGTVPSLIQDLLTDYGYYTLEYGSFEGTKGVNIHSFPNFGRALIKGNIVKLYVMDGSTSVYLDGILSTRVKNVKVYGNDNADFGTPNLHRISVSGIPVHDDYTPAVVDIEFDGEVVSEAYSNFITANQVVLKALAFDTNGAKLQGYDDRSYEIGSWTSSSAWIETTFIFLDTSSTFYVTGTFPSGNSNSLVITAVFTDVDANTTQTITMTKGTPKSSSKVSLTKGKIYKVRLTHNGGGSNWVNLSQITFSKT
jgi:alpha-L-fucosidase